MAVVGLRNQLKRVDNGFRSCSPLPSGYRKKVADLQDVPFVTWEEWKDVTLVCYDVIGRGRTKVDYGNMEYKALYHLLDVVDPCIAAALNGLAEYFPPLQLMPCRLMHQ